MMLNNEYPRYELDENFHITESTRDIWVYASDIGYRIVPNSICAGRSLYLKMGKTWHQFDFSSRNRHNDWTFVSRDENPYNNWWLRIINR